MTNSLRRADEVADLFISYLAEKQTGIIQV